MKRIWNYLLVLLLFGASSYGQNVGIGTATPNASAILELSSTNRGFLMTRVSLAGTNDATTIPTPATGLLVYNTNTSAPGATAVTPGFYYWDGTQWVRLLNTQSDDWTIFGNAGTNPTTNFIGTTDAQDLAVRTNNAEVMRVMAAGNVGIGTTAPITNVRLQVSGNATYSTGVLGLADTIGVLGVAVTEGASVYGLSLAPTVFGGRFVGGASRAGIFGYIDGMTLIYYPGAGGSFVGDPVAVFGYTDSANATSVYGLAVATGGWGVYGVASGVNGSGVVGEASDAGGYGVRGVNTAATGTGIVAAGNGTIPASLVDGSGLSARGNDGMVGWGNAGTGTGVYGVGNARTVAQRYVGGSGGAFTGDTVGVYAYTDAADASVASVYAVYAGTTNVDARGVFGYSAPATGFGIGVHGYGGYIGVLGVDPVSNSNTEFAVLAVGDMAATGNKPFVIDHPADPENKLLKHFALESNEILNVYRGNVVLDNNGQAEVQLPDYFHLINKNFSYNLTPIGGPAQLYILQEIDQNGKFIIAGGKPGQKVSWYVYAERNDPYLQKYPIKRQVEIEKPDRMKGKYFHPELYGQPEEKAIFYTPDPMKKTTSEKAIILDKEVKNEALNKNLTKISEKTPMVSPR